MLGKFHINKHGVPSPCHASKGKCPLGGESGNENHFDSAEKAEAYVQEMNAKEHGILPEMSKQEGSYEGSPYEMSDGAASNFVGVNESNVKEKLSKAFESGESSVSYKTEDFNNNPVEFDATIEKVGEDTYRVKGEIREYSMAEEDFDEYEEYEEYLEDGPDSSYSTNFEMTGDELKQTLSESGRFERKLQNENDGAGLVTSGIYDLSRENME